MKKEPGIQERKENYLKSPKGMTGPHNKDAQCNTRHNPNDSMTIQTSTKK